MTQAQDPQPTLFSTPLDTEMQRVDLQRIKPGTARTVIPSVRLMGVMQPVLLRTTPRGPYAYEVVDGNRRDHSARTFGHTDIPAIITDGSEAQLAAARAVLNTSRSPNPVQEARAWQGALASGVYGSVEAMARDLGVNVQTVRQRLRLMQLPDQLLDGIQEGHISEGVAEKIANLDPAYRARAVQRYGELQGAGERFTADHLKEVRTRREGDLTRTVLGSLMNLPASQQAAPLLSLDPLALLAQDVKRLAQERGVSLDDLATALSFVTPTPSAPTNADPAPLRLTAPRPSLSTRRNPA